MLLASAATGIGSGAVVGIGLDIYAVNNFSGPAAAAGASLKTLQSEFRRTMYENLRVARNVYGGLAAAGLIVTRGATQMYRKFAEFDYVMRGTQIVSQATEDQFKALRSEALRLGETTMFYADDIGTSMREMAKSGMGVDDILNNIRASVAGAGASMESLDITTRAIISTLAQFQIPSQHAMSVMDKLTAAALGSKSTIAQLSEALKYSAADFYALKIPLDTAMGMLMTMHNFGIEASMAGTAMGNALRYMSKAQSDLRTGRQSAALQMFGLTPEDFQTAKGEFKDMTHIFGMLSEKIAGMKTIEGQVAMEALFGIRGKRAAFPMAAATEQVAKNIERVANAAGMSEKNMQKMMTTPEGNILKMISAFKTMVIVLGESFKPAFNTITIILKNIAQLITWLTGGKGKWWSPLVKGIMSTLAVFIALRSVIWGIKALLAGLMMMATSNRISFSNMNKSMSTGWAILKARALGYKGVVDGIIVSQNMLNKTAIMGMSGGMALYTGKAPLPSQLVKYNKHGRPIAADKIQDLVKGKTYKKGSFLPYGMAGLGAGTVAKKGIATGLGRMGIGAALGKAGSFMLGPWGMGIMLAVVTVSQLLNKSVKKNTESVDKNTESQNKASSYKDRPRYDPEFFNEAAIISRILEKQMLQQSIEKGTFKPKSKTEVIINIDGKNKFRTVLGSNLSKQLINMGLE